jgi:ribosomal protein S18 acetylase RimI-like enzyme
VTGECEIRAAEPPDVEGVLALWSRAGHRPSPTDAATSLDELIAEDAGTLIVADAQGSVVGSIIAAWDGWRGNIYRLVVDPSRSRDGVGAQLIAGAEQRLRTCGARRIVAFVEREREFHDVWSTAGYEPDGQTLRFLRDVRDPADRQER